MKTKTMPGSTTLRVRDVMTREAATIGRNEKVSAADELMSKRRIRHVAVLDEDGNLAGVLSRKDLFRGSLATALGYGSTAQQKLLDTLLAKEVMTTEVVIIGPDAPLAEAARLMLEKKIGCLPVVQEDRLVGILTEGDFVALAARSE
jgi:CBS domain-containing membrane protein